MCGQSDTELPLSIGCVQLSTKYIQKIFDSIRQIVLTQYLRNLCDQVYRVTLELLVADQLLARVADHAVRWRLKKRDKRN